MPERLLQLDDLRNLTSPEKIATLFERLGYNAEAQPLHVEDLQLTARSAETVDDAYLIADQGNGGLQVLLFQLQPEEWEAEIDDRVAHLYGLTDEEMKIIRGE